MWKAPAQGGSAIQVTRDGGGLPFESPDGKWLYFTKEDGAAGLWKMPVDGGPGTQVVKAMFRDNFSVLDRGIYFTPRGANGKLAVQFLDFDTGAVKTIDHRSGINRLPGPLRWVPDRSIKSLTHTAGDAK